MDMLLPTPQMVATLIIAPPPPPQEAVSTPLSLFAFRVLCESHTEQNRLFGIRREEREPYHPPSPQKFGEGGLAEAS